MFDKYRPNEKKYYQYDCFIFYFTLISTNLSQVGSLVTEIQSFGKDVRLILYNINLLQKP